MPRPKSKGELLEQSAGNYKKLIAFIEDLPEEKRNTEFAAQYLNRNIRDVLAHLHHWHSLFLRWYVEGMNGTQPQMPALGHTWRTVPELNIEIRELYKNTPKVEIDTQLKKSFKDVQEIIKSHSDIELFEKQHYPWTGSTSLGAYIISATSSHYDWGLKLIRKALK